MKKALPVGVMCLTILCGLFWLSNPIQAEDNPTLFFTLDNGMKVFLQEKHSIPLVNCVVAFEVGSKNENDQNNGLVHILEHYILFRGTKFRSGEEISRDIRSHGAYFNAHTGRDLSLFEMTLPGRYLDFALRNQKEILFDLKFDQTALDAEKQVILEELNQLYDDPFKLASSLTYQALFQSHPYHRPIYGKEENIKNATIEQLQEFHSRYFTPENSALAIVGDIELEKTKALLKEIFGPIPTNERQAEPFNKASLIQKTVEIEKEMDVNMGYLAVALPGPDYNHADQYKIDVLTEIFGRGVNPLLYHPMMNKRIIANSLSMSYVAHKYGGSILILLAVDAKNLKRAKKEIVNYIKNSRKLDFSSDDVLGDRQFYVMDYVTSAQNRIRFRGERANERGLAIATSLARYMLLNELSDRGNYLEKIGSVKSSDLRQAAGKYLNRKAYAIVMIKPAKKKK